MALYEVSPVVKKQIDQAFSNPIGMTDDQGKRIDQLQLTARTFADTIARCCPPSRETSLALIKIDEACMMGVAAIARHEHAVAYPPVSETSTMGPA